jgi:hypothetical protein
MGRLRKCHSCQGPIQLDGNSRRAIEAPEDFDEELRTNAIPPVMSYFRPDKQTRSGVSFIAQQRDRFDKLVETAPTVAIVGIKCGGMIRTFGALVDGRRRS